MVRQFQNYNRKVQTLLSVATILIVTGICFALGRYMDYKVVAFIYFLTLSLLAVIADILPVMITAAISALLWNLLFIEPRFSFHIATIQDAILFSIYFLISFLNAIFTYRIRKAERLLRQKEERAQVLLLYNTIFSSLSHELKTPIATIIGAADMLAEKQPALTEDQEKELISQVSQAALRLDRQTENLLNMSRLESGTIRLKKDWCDINELLHSIGHGIDNLLQQRRLTIDSDPGLPLFKVDHFLLEQVIYNLLYNACLYTPDHSEIKIRARNIQEKFISLESADITQENNRLELVIEDNGPGFPPEDLEKVFDKFYRLKNARAGGTGLGLSIAKGFCESHGGTIELENIPHGCRFTILLPAEVSYLNKLKNE